ncbi:FAD/FMN-containing isoamyl alcohol oxidase-like protein MreA, partial [Stipitochalara longipes BDJ]
LPGDAGWPDVHAWNRLNITVRGRLIATVPAAHVCHDPNYNETASSILKTEWDTVQAHIFTPGEIMAPYFQNQSCDPFTAELMQCMWGNYVSYSINVTSFEDVKAGIKFSNDKNIRLVIKNTGNDYLGKSTGKGGLALWTHNLKSINIVGNYKSCGYNGPAIRIGAGVIAAEAYLEAHNYGYRMVGGTCPTVGLAGGYTQGGGHSLLNGPYGLGADNVLEWEVVTTEGKYVTATLTENQDLYWALSCGGGGTYGVVLSLTAKIHQDGPIGGAFLAFSAADIGQDTFWQAIDFFHSSLPPIVDTGATVLYQFTQGTFAIVSLTAPDRNITQVGNLLAPFLAGLSKLKIPFKFAPSYFDNYYDHFAASFGPLPYGPFPVSQFTSSRLVSRTALAQEPAAVSKAFRNTVKDGNFYMVCQALNPNLANNSANAVLPTWRETLTHCIAVGPRNWTIPYADMVARERELTEDIMPMLEEVTPDSGTYLNEGNFAQLDWQQQFYGENYDRLSEVKSNYDPSRLLYAVTAVGSEKWIQESDGRLCRAN